MAGLEDLIEAWYRSPALHDLTEGASEAGISDATARLGRPLASQLVSILRFAAA